MYKSTACVRGMFIVTDMLTWEHNSFVLYDFSSKILQWDFFGCFTDLYKNVSLVKKIREAGILEFVWQKKWWLKTQAKIARHP